MNNPSSGQSGSLIKQPKARWLMLALVWLAYASFGITTGSLLPLVTTIIDDLDITSAQMGLILGAWQLTYIVTAIPMGALVDKFGPKRSISIGTAVILLSLVLRGFAVDFWTLLFAVIVFGLGGPIISIGAPKVTAQWFRGNQRGVAAGIYATGPWAGMAISSAAAAAVVLPLTGSWRGISIVYGVVVAVVMIAWLIFAREAPGSSQDAETETGLTPPSQLTIIKGLLSTRNLQVILVLAVGAFFIGHALQAWIPTFLEEKGFTPAEAGNWAAIVLIGTVVGQLFIPPLAKAGWRVQMLAFLFAITAITTAGQIMTDGSALLVVMFISSGFRSAFMSVMTLILMESRGIGSRYIGSAAGLFFAAAEIGGFGGPALLGLMRGATGNLITGFLTVAIVSAGMILLLPLLKENVSQPDSLGSSNSR